MTDDISLPRLILLGKMFVMQFSVEKVANIVAPTDALVLFVPAGPHGAVFSGLPPAFSKLVRQEITDTAFTAKSNELCLISTHGLVPAKRLVLVGLGPKKQITVETVRRAAATVVRRFQKIGVGHLAVVVPDSLATSDAVTAVVEGAALGHYRYAKYRSTSPEDKKDIEQCVLIVSGTAQQRQAEAVLARVVPVVDGVLLARDLVNEPASIATPKHLVDVAHDIAKAHPTRIKVEIFDRATCKKMGMGAFLSVASGAGEEPYFIHLTYKPTRKAKKKIALVGKGITFDSGGLQIKDDKNMSTMKCDMSGAAAVLGVFQALPALALPIEVHGIIAATENMPGPLAYKPGDVVRAMNGKTIDIGHTDAEGRVTLADALAFGAALAPDAMIDLATLTGAAVVALGEEVAALMSNNQRLAERVKAGAEETGERLWQLPLVEEYRDLIKGHHGDLSNTGSTRYGGSITAGLFLREFVADVPWVHLDIAGPAWAERDTVPYVPKGGTGFGVRTMIQLLADV